MDITKAGFTKVLGLTMLATRYHVATDQALTALSEQISELADKAEDEAAFIEGMEKLHAEAKQKSEDESNRAAEYLASLTK